MKNKQLLIAIVVLVVLGAAWIFTKEDSGKSSSNGESTKPTNQVIETLDATKLASITLTDSDGSVTVDQVDGKWSVTDRDGFPANFSNIQSLVDSVTELKILAKQKVGKSQLGRFELNDPAPEDAKDAGTKLELKDADGNVLHSILFGKETQGQADPSSPFGPSGTGRYVLVGPNTVGEINETLSSDLKTGPADWLHKEDFLKVEKIKSITITQPNEADSWTLTHIKEGDDMALSDAKPEEKLDSSKGNSAGRVLGSPSFDDIASKSAKPEETGMDKAVTATIDTFEGYNYVVKMAKKDDEHYMSLAASGTRLAQADETAARTPQPDESNPRAQAKDEKPEDAERLDKEHNAALAKLIADRDKAHAESQAKLREERDTTFADNLAKLAKLEGWTFKVSSYTFDAIYKTRAEMMEEEKEEAAQGAATPPPILPALPPLPIPSTPAPAIAPITAPITVQPPKPAEPNKVVTSDIIKVPSAEEMKKGAKIEVIKKEDLPAEIEKAKQQTEKADDKK